MYGMSLVLMWKVLIGGLEVTFSLGEVPSCQELESKRQELTLGVVKGGPLSLILPQAGAI